MDTKATNSTGMLIGRVAKTCLGTFGFCWVWGKGQKERVRAGVVRGGLWVFGVFIALLPAVQASKASFSIDLEAMASAANKAGFFRDFFFVTIVIAILATSNIFDSILKTGGKVGFFSAILFTILFVYFGIHVAYGISHFVEIAHGSPLGQQDFSHDYNIIWDTFAAGLLTEFVIAFREPLASVAANAQKETGHG